MNGGRSWKGSRPSSSSRETYPNYFPTTELNYPRIESHGELRSKGSPRGEVLIHPRGRCEVGGIPGVGGRACPRLLPQVSRSPPSIAPCQRKTHGGPHRGGTHH